MTQSWPPGTGIYGIRNMATTAMPDFDWFQWHRPPIFLPSTPTPWLSTASTSTTGTTFSYSKQPWLSCCFSWSAPNPLSNPHLVEWYSRFMTLTLVCFWFHSKNQTSSRPPYFLKFWLPLLRFWPHWSSQSYLHAWPGIGQISEFIAMSKFRCYFRYQVTVTKSLLSLRFIMPISVR